MPDSDVVTGSESGAATQKQGNQGFYERWDFVVGLSVVIFGVDNLILGSQELKLREQEIQHVRNLNEVDQCK